MKSENIPDCSLDAFDLCCPSPLLRTKALLTRLSTGQTIAVRRVHFLQITDFENWCERTEQTLLSKVSLSADLYDILIRKK
jgi:TusA-related sulfurtransferase